MSHFFSFISGTVFGMYLSQNYDVPNIKYLSTMFITYVKSLEKKQDDIENNNKKNK